MSKFNNVVFPLEHDCLLLSFLMRKIPLKPNKIDFYLINN